MSKVTNAAEFRGFSGSPIEEELRALAEADGLELDELVATNGVLHKLVYVKVTGEPVAVRDFMKTAGALQSEYTSISFLRQR